MRRLILIGPPGAGKGTQARLLGERLGLPHISSGDLLRDAVERDTEKGREAKAYMERGELVPDAVVVSLIEDRLRRSKGSGFLLDGFPRNIAQADVLAKMLAAADRDVEGVISIRVPNEVVVERLSGRRTCRSCGAMYHGELDPPAEAERCNECGGELYQRDDDREETIRARLEVFARETEPLLEYYRSRGLLHGVDGVGSPEEVFGRILEIVAPES